MANARRNLNTHTANRYRLMIEAGRDNKYIAARMGVKEKTVENWRNALKAEATPLAGDWRGHSRAAYRAEFEQGTLNKVIAEKFGVELNQVRKMRRRCGFPPESAIHAPEAVDIDWVAERFNAGRTIPSIATELGVRSRRVEGVVRIARHKGLIKRPKQFYHLWTEDELARAREMLEEGMSYAMTVAELGYGEGSVNSLARHLPGMGWTPSQAQQYRHMKEKLDRL